MRTTLKILGFSLVILSTISLSSVRASTQTLDELIQTIESKKLSAHTNAHFFTRQAGDMVDLYGDASVSRLTGEYIAVGAIALSAYPAIAYGAGTLLAAETVTIAGKSFAVAGVLRGVFAAGVGISMLLETYEEQERFLTCFNKYENNKTIDEVMPTINFNNLIESIVEMDRAVMKAVTKISLTESSERQKIYNEAGYLSRWKNWYVTDQIREQIKANYAKSEVYKRQAKALDNLQGFLNTYKEILNGSN